eukprot:jgi/Ulvmu1/1252/UM109_0050.1
MDGKKLGRDAYQLALRHGGTDEKIQALMDRDTLLTILQEANIEADICEDVADACDINDLDALIFASGLLSVNDVAEACFLTKDEAEVLCTNCAHKAFAFDITFGREAVVSPRRLGTFRRSPRAADAPTAPTVAPADEASGPFGSDSLAFDSPAQSPSSRPKKPRPPVSALRPAVTNGTDLRKSPLAEEVASEPARRVAAATSANNAPPPRITPVASSASKQRAVPLAGTNGVLHHHATAPSAKTSSAAAATLAPSSAAPSSVGPSDSSMSATDIAAPANGAVAATTENGRQPSSGDASQTDLFSGNHAAGDSNAATPRFADSAAAFSPGPGSARASADAAGQPSGSAAPPQQSSPTKAVPAASLVAAVPASSASSQPPGKQLSTALAGSAPDSPKTPRDGRDTLTVESCQLNTGSSVQPQPAMPSHSEGRRRSPAGRPTSGSVMAYPGPAALSPPASASVPYAAAYHGVTPPASAPGFMVGRQMPAAVNVQGSPMRSPRSTMRPRTPTGPLSRRGVASSYPPPEALEELGSTFLKYPGVLPHFMRPTAAHEHRMKPEPEDSRSASPPARRPRSVAPNAHFIQPTASYVAKVAHAPSESSTPKRAQSACVPPRNRGHAPTAFAPFCLHTEMRLPQKNKMTTDELRIAELKKQRQEEAMKRRTQLKRLQHERARTESPDVLSPRATKSKPFQLASVARHERELQARKAMLVRQAEEDARNKQFRARQYNPSQFKDAGVRRPVRASEPGARKITQPKGPSFMSDDRLGYRRDVLEGRFADTHEAHRARHAESMARREEKARLEAERVAKEREFKARPAPKSSARFKLDATKVKPTTVPKPFALSGPRGIPPGTPGSEAPSRGCDSMEVPTPMRVVTPQGVMSEFMRSLRV